MPRRSMVPLSQRAPLLVLAIILCVPLAYVVLPWRTRYWLMRDGVEGTAVVTAEGSHGSVFYNYAAMGKTFAGHSQTNWRDDRYRTAGAGQRVPVWYSASHPWLSMLYMPDAVVDGLLVVVILVVMEVGIIVSALWPATGRRLWLGTRD